MILYSSRNSQETYLPSYLPTYIGLFSKKDLPEESYKSCQLLKIVDGSSIFIGQEEFRGKNRLESAQEATLKLYEIGRKSFFRD